MILLSALAKAWSLLMRFFKIFPSCPWFGCLGTSWTQKQFSRSQVQLVTTSEANTVKCSVKMWHSKGLSLNWNLFRDSPEEEENLLLSYCSTLKKVVVVCVIKNTLWLTKEWLSVSWLAPEKPRGALKDQTDTQVTSLCGGGWLEWIVHYSPTWDR